MSTRPRTHGAVELAGEDQPARPPSLALEPVDDLLHLGEGAEHVDAVDAAADAAAPLGDHADRPVERLAVRVAERMKSSAASEAPTSSTGMPEGEGGLKNRSPRPCDP